MRDRRCVEDLTIPELEEVLMIRRREERMARTQRLGAASRLGRRVLVPEPAEPTPVLQTAAEGLRGDTLGWRGQGLGSGHASDIGQAPKTQSRLWRDRILLGTEVAAVVGLIVILIILASNVRGLNQDWKEQQGNNPLPTPSATPLIRVAILPGGHKPPGASGEEAEPLGQTPRIAIPTPGPRSPTRLVVSSIDIDVPVVEGDSWEQLKKGAGHHIGSANPGERGNCFISGHNDIYGEIFRRLDEVQIGDEIVVYAGKQPYTYIVRATRIVEPDDVSVMYPTSSPVLTLMTCYPYMIDTDRLVVIAELERSS
jgi:sortase A